MELELEPWLQGAELRRRGARERFRWRGWLGCPLRGQGLSPTRLRCAVGDGGVGEGNEGGDESEAKDVVRKQGWLDWEKRSSED